MNFYGDQSAIDLREELSALLRGRADLVPQGREVILRRIRDEHCTVCWDPTAGGSSRQMCKYCQGEGYLFSETLELVYLTRGVAPVYKPGNLGTGKYPQADYGYADPNRATCFIEAVTPDGRVTFPDYERYTLQQHDAYDKLFELKVTLDGETAHPLVRTAVWKVLTAVPYHGDYGRIEFLELGLEKQNI
jgi:hypothetical protein